MPSRWDDDAEERVAKDVAEQKTEDPEKAVPRPSARGGGAVAADGAEAGSRWVAEPAPDLQPPQPLSEGTLPPAGRPERTALQEEAAAAIKVDTDPKRLKEGANKIKVGILGGKGVGKSYLFQAMVYRIRSTTHAGVLSYYMRDLAAELSISDLNDTLRRKLVIPDFLEGYSRMVRLEPTAMETQRWYHLQLNFATGMFGGAESTMNIEFLDGSGEALEMGLAIPLMRKLWEEAYKDATVMIFCLPIWTLFPDGEEMSEDDWDHRDRWLRGFAKVVTTYQEIRNRDLKVRSVLVLTMADDRKSALRTLYRRWIKPCIEVRGADTFLNQVRKGSGITRYLSTAREVSQYLYRELKRVEFGGQVTDPAQLNFGHGLPWIVPVSALDGEKLLQIEEERVRNPGYKYRGQPPIPAHVELPLLAAMCEHYNALM